MPLAEPPPNNPSVPNLRKETKQLSLGMAHPSLQLSSQLSPCSETFLRLQSSVQSQWTRGMAPPILWGTGRPCWEISLCFPYGFSPGPVLNHHQQKLSHARQLLLPAIVSNTPKIKVVHSVSHLSGQSSHRFSPAVPIFWNANSITTYAKAAHEYI